MNLYHSPLKETFLNRVCSTEDTERVFAITPLPQCLVREVGFEPTKRSPIDDEPLMVAAVFIYKREYIGTQMPLSGDTMGLEPTTKSSEDFCSTK